MTQLILKVLCTEPASTGAPNTQTILIHSMEEWNARVPLTEGQYNHVEFFLNETRITGPQARNFLLSQKIPEECVQP